FERDDLARLGMPKEIVLRHRLPQFLHLFASDSYSAGYYSYLWSEVMDADAWRAFEEAGNPFDQATAQRMRKYILAPGNSTDRAEAFREFRGRDPDVTALLGADREAEDAVARDADERLAPAPLLHAGKGQSLVTEGLEAALPVRGF